LIEQSSLDVKSWRRNRIYFTIVPGAANPPFKPARKKMLDIDPCSCELIRWLHRDAENIGHLFEKRPKVGSLFMVAALRGVRQIASRNFMSMLTMSILTEKSGRDR
jgi:hypothetical protein